MAASYSQGADIYAIVIWLAFANIILYLYEMLDDVMFSLRRFIICLFSFQNEYTTSSRRFHAYFCMLSTAPHILQ